MTNYKSNDEVEGVKTWLRSIYEAGVHEADYDKYEAEVLKAIHQLRQDDREALIEEVESMRDDYLSSRAIDALNRVVDHLKSLDK